MNKPLKKIIAREGLIMIGCVIIGCISFYLLPYLPKSAIPVPTRPLTVIEVISKHRDFVGLYAYLMFQLIRFIIWALKTLKEK